MGDTVEVLSQEEVQSRVHSPPTSGRSSITTARAGGPRSPGVGPRACLHFTRRQDLRELQGRMAGGLARRRACPHPLRGRDRRARRARNERLSAATEEDAQVRRSGLRLRHGHRTTFRAQMESIGWSGREGIADSGNQFHYYRLTSDNSILWGGYDTIYNFRGKVRREYEFNSRPTRRSPVISSRRSAVGRNQVHARLGGAIDTCTRFSPFWGTSHENKVAYVLGYTGSESPRPGSAPRRCSICWTDSRPTALD